MMILKKNIKEVIYLILNLFFHVINIILLKFEFFKINFGEEFPNIINNIHDYVKKIMGKENKPKNAFHNDPNVPDNNINMIIVKLTKNIKAENRKITKKIYILFNGKKYMVEIEDNNKIYLNKI